MKVSEDDFRRRYAELNDEGLLSIDPEALVDVARRCYDDELTKRGLQARSHGGQEPEGARDESVIGVAVRWLVHATAMAAKRAFLSERWRLKMAIGAAGGLAMTGLLLHQRHQEQMDQAYREASSLTTADAASAVRRLAAFQGKRSTAMLLELALGLQPWDSGSIPRVIAIDALAERKDPAVAPALARLLQPHVTQPVRKAVSDALQKIQCLDDCMASVLHYLERTSQGEQNAEERRMPSAQFEGMTDFESDVRAMLTKDETAVYDSLYVVLQRQSKATVRMLVIIHGLGTDTPSKFALNVLSRARLQDACPALQESYHALEKETYRDRERRDVEATIQAVGCK